MNDKQQLAALGADIAQQQEPLCMAKQVEQLQELLIESLRGRRVGTYFAVRCAQVCDIGLVEGLCIDGRIGRGTERTDTTPVPIEHGYCELQAQLQDATRHCGVMAGLLREIAPCVSFMINRIGDSDTLRNAEQLADRIDEELDVTVATASSDPTRDLVWRNTGSPNGLRRFITQKQYGAQTPGVQKWYEPIRHEVPEGWKLVPVEPDYSMLSADGCKEHAEGKNCVHHDNRRRIWAAMLAAAPSPDSSK